MRLVLWFLNSLLKRRPKPKVDTTPRFGRQWMKARDWTLRGWWYVDLESGEILTHVYKSSGEWYGARGHFISLNDAIRHAEQVYSSPEAEIKELEKLL